jgi:hypothetical protein
VENEGDHGAQQQEVNEASGDVEDAKTRDPGDQENNEQNGPEAHLGSPLAAQDKPGGQSKG